MSSVAGDGALLRLIGEGFMALTTICGVWNGDKGRVGDRMILKTEHLVSYNGNQSRVLYGSSVSFNTDFEQNVVNDWC